MNTTIKQHSLATLIVGSQSYQYCDLNRAAEQLGTLSRLPKSLKVLLENLLRHEDGRSVTQADLHAVANWQQTAHAEREIAFRPARVLMQDFTGVPAIVDLAAMREAVARLGGDVARVNPRSPVDLVIDHSVMADKFGSASAFADNVAIEMHRNRERYTFLRWGQQAFDQFRVVPPGTGICHQVNLEYLGQTVFRQTQGDTTWVYPDTLVGTDSHTTMINGLGILGWGVGGIEAEAAMLGQPVSMLIPDVVGFRLTGRLRAGITATDLVLTVTQMLRAHGVVGKFVEFFGDGLAQLPLADRATIANMAPEYGATCGFFPVDDITLDYLRLSGRSEEHIALVQTYCQQQGLWREAGDEPVFTSTLTLDLDTVTACLAGPKRPQDRVPLSEVPHVFQATASKVQKRVQHTGTMPIGVDGRSKIDDGAVVIAAITSCTNTSNPSVMMAAGLLAQKAVAAGLQCRPWVKTSLAPGSKVVTDYLDAAGLQPSLDQLGFQLVGYGCTTCIGNSGPLPPVVENAITTGDLTVAAVLSGNRNFEGRIHPLVRTNWLASPPLVVAYALAGSININLLSDPIGHNSAGQAVYLRDIWPNSEEIAQAVHQVQTAMFHKEYSQVFDGDDAWQAIAIAPSDTYAWQANSTYIRHPPFFDTMQAKPEPVADIVNARMLVMLGDSVTTDHISPAGNIKADSPAGRYLSEHGVAPSDFNSYGARRGNHEVMMRGTFANIRINNEMLATVEGGYTRYLPTGEQLAIYDVAMRYRDDGTPLVVVAGKEYGSGSSRDWAAKGSALLGIRVVIAESFERIHRANLIGMGVLPLVFPPHTDRHTLGLSGNECFSISGLTALQPGQDIAVHIRYADGREHTVMCHCRIDTGNEVAYYEHGGILPYVIRQML